MWQTQLTGNHGQQQHQLFKNEDNVKIPGAMGFGGEWMLSRIWHRHNPTNNCGRLARKMRKLSFSSNQHCMMKFFRELQQLQPPIKHGRLLKQEFFGDKKVITLKLQTLRREFETLAMKEREHVQEFLSGVFGIVSYMKTYGESVNSEPLLAKCEKSNKIF